MKKKKKKKNCSQDQARKVSRSGIVCVGNRGWLRAWRNHGHLLLCLILLLLCHVLVEYLNYMVVYFVASLVYTDLTGCLLYKALFST